MKPAHNAKTERNKQIYKDWKSGMLGVDMVAKYRISSQAIYNIVKRIELAIDNSSK
jgi:Mor family transcriptional regulator